MIHSHLILSTHGQGLYEFTDNVTAFVREAGVASAICNIFVQHTSCSLIIQENADPEVQTDLKNFFARLVPPTSDPSMNYITHTYEGPDDMPAHIKAALTQTSVSVPVIEGRMALGTWQGIYLFEHRDRPHSRNVILSILGE
ncbi:MAG: secondary thiamine-phosphate synthase enzyme YjbQ [Rhizobiaceae bacterium]|nr:secondary thiamine-phosphate synthase enzyme YjbQ [Rhizobiaceae bacterium]